jgi:hypothetical protein
MALYRRGQIWHYDFWYRGRRYRGSTEEKSKTRARRMEAMLMLKAREKPGFILASRVPVLLEFAPRFLEWVEASTLEPATKEYYQYGWQMLEKTSIPQMRLDAISKDSAEVLRFPGSNANGNRALRTLRRMLGKAEEWGFISRPPRIRLLKEQGREMVITPEMEARILKVAPPAAPGRDRHDPRLRHAAPGRLSDALGACQLAQANDLRAVWQDAAVAALRSDERPHGRVAPCPYGRSRELRLGLPFTECARGPHNDRGEGLATNPGKPGA